MMSANPSNAGQQTRSAAGLDSSNPLALVAQILGGMQGFAGDSSDPIIAATQRANRGLFPLVQDRRRTNRINERRRAMRVGQGGRTKAQIERDEANRERRRKENAERKAAREQRRQDRAIDESMMDLEAIANANAAAAGIDPNTGAPAAPPAAPAGPSGFGLAGIQNLQDAVTGGRGEQSTLADRPPQAQPEGTAPVGLPPGIAGDPGNIFRGPAIDPFILDYLEGLREGRENQGTPVQQPPAAPSGPLGPGGPSGLRGGPGYDTAPPVTVGPGGPSALRGGPGYDQPVPVMGPPTPEPVQPGAAYGTQDMSPPVSGSPYATGTNPLNYLHGPPAPPPGGHAPYTPPAPVMPPPGTVHYGQPQEANRPPDRSMTPEQARQMQHDIDMANLMAARRNQELEARRDYTANMVDLENRRAFTMGLPGMGPFQPPSPPINRDMTPEQARQMQLDIDRGRMMAGFNERQEAEARAAMREQYDRADQGMNLEERRAAEGDDPVRRIIREQAIDRGDPRVTDESGYPVGSRAYQDMMLRGREFAPPDPPPLLRDPYLYPVPQQPQGPPRRFFHYPPESNPLMALPRTTSGSQDLYSTFGVPFR